MSYASRAELLREADLEALANVKSWKPPFTNMGAEMYGAGAALRQYGYYPKWLPIWLEATHSTNQHLMLNVKDYEVFYKDVLVYVQRYKAVYDLRSRSTCHHSPAPFTLYRQLHNITQSADSKGTIVFYSHSVSTTNAVVDLEQYIEELNALPEEMKPVTVCLHYLDIHRKIHESLIENGINCVTAGNGFHDDFIARFYEIIRHHKYALANSWSSALLYCVDLGLPVSIYGTKAKIVSKGVKWTDLQAGQTYQWHLHLLNKHWDWYSAFYGVDDVEDEPAATKSDRRFDRMNKARKAFQDPNIAYIRDTFTGLNTQITPEQLEIARIELGQTARISRLKLSWLLYSALLKTPLFLAYRFVTNKAEGRLFTRMIVEKIKRDMKR